MQVLQTSIPTSSEDDSFLNIRGSEYCECTCALDNIAGTSIDAADSGPPPLHLVRCPDHFCLESFPQELKVRRSKMY